MLKIFKKIDKFIGTPICYFLGLFVKEKSIPQPETIKKILIIKLIAMGDIIVILPTLRAVRNKYPNAKIYFLTTPSMKALLQSSPDVDEVITLDISRDTTPWGLINFINNLNKLKFNIVLELTHYYRLVSIITFLAKIPHRVGFAISGQGRNMLLTKRIKYNDDLHEVESFGTIAEAVNAPLKNKQLISPTFNTRQEDIHYVKTWLENRNIKKFIVIHPGTSAIAKSRRWPAEKFRELADKLTEKGYDIIFSGAKEEMPIITKILSSTNKKYLNLVGKTTLSQLLELFKKARVVISLDTGPMHLSAASGTPTLGLFGANTPKKWGPYGQQHKSIYHGPDKPCTRQQYGYVCKHSEGYHMHDISVEEVLESTLNILRKKL